MLIEKSTFNKLDIDEQVHVCNQVLEEEKEIKNVCGRIGISYSTIRDRFHRKGYRYNKFINQYQKLNKREIKEDELEEKINTILNNRINADSFQLGEIDFTDEVVVRSFRIRKNVLNDFMVYSENSALKQYDILSLFLREGMNKYKKR